MPRVQQPTAGETHRVGQGRFGEALRRLLAYRRSPLSCDRVDCDADVLAGLPVLFP